MTEVLIAELTGSDNLTASFYMTYDTSLRVVRFRCDNRSGALASGELVQTGDARGPLKTFAAFLPGTNTMVPVPAVWADRLQLTREPDGDLIGVDMNLGIDEPPGVRAMADGHVEAVGSARVRGPVRLRGKV